MDEKFYVVLDVAIRTSILLFGIPLLADFCERHGYPGALLLFLFGLARFLRDPFQRSERQFFYMATRHAVGTILRPFLEILSVIKSYMIVVPVLFIMWIIEFFRNEDFEYNFIRYVDNFINNADADQQVEVDQ